eukprot:COSAG05_NODE_1477_length_4781_cov_6.449381_3_plen_108_part_00
MSYVAAWRILSWQGLRQCSSSRAVDCMRWRHRPQARRWFDVPPRVEIGTTVTQFTCLIHSCHQLRHIGVRRARPNARSPLVISRTNATLPQRTTLLSTIFPSRSSNG